jgi:ankyrin repeat protein
MRTRRTTLWLLTSILALIIVLPVLPGQAAGDAPLVAAAKDDDLQTVRALLAKQVSVNEPARDGSTALLWAAYHSISR